VRDSDRRPFQLRQATSEMTDCSRNYTETLDHAESYSDKQDEL
jgi:hypothetical protein